MIMKRNQIKPELNGFLNFRLCTKWPAATLTTQKKWIQGEESSLILYLIKTEKKSGASRGNRYIKVKLEQVKRKGKLPLNTKLFQECSHELTFYSSTQSLSLSSLHSCTTGTTTLEGDFFSLFSFLSSSSTLLLFIIQTP